MKKPFAIILLATLFSCQQSVTRVAPDTQIDLSGRWNDSDSRLVADKMISELMASERFKEYAKEKGRKPAIVVGLIRNKTSEHIDADTYIKKLEVAIYNSNVAEVL
jgi:PBP1b-binding outer membrane lipoprotein LpoB